MPEHFAAEVTRMGLDVSMAELQGHLLRHKGQPLEVIHKLPFHSRSLRRTHILLVAQALVSTPDLAAEALARQQTSKWNSKGDQNTEPGAEGSDGTQEDHAGDDGAAAASRARRLHGSEADRVVFNPQEGWEDMIGQVVRKR